MIARHDQQRLLFDVNERRPDDETFHLQSLTQALTQQPLPTNKTSPGDNDDSGDGDDKNNDAPNAPFEFPILGVHYPVVTPYPPDSQIFALSARPSPPADLNVDYPRLQPPGVDARVLHIEPLSYLDEHDDSDEDSTPKNNAGRKQTRKKPWSPGLSDSTVKPVESLRRQSRSFLSSSSSSSLSSRSSSSSSSSSSSFSSSSSSSFDSSSSSASSSSSFRSPPRRRTLRRHRHQNTRRSVPSTSSSSPTPSLSSVLDQLSNATAHSRVLQRDAWAQDDYSRMPYTGPSNLTENLFIESLASHPHRAASPQLQPQRHKRRRYSSVNQRLQRHYMSRRAPPPASNPICHVEMPSGAAIASGEVTQQEQQYREDNDYGGQNNDGDNSNSNNDGPCIAFAPDGTVRSLRISRLHPRAATLCHPCVGASANCRTDHGRLTHVKHAQGQGQDPSLLLGVTEHDAVLFTADYARASLATASVFSLSTDKAELNNEDGDDIVIYDAAINLHCYETAFLTNSSLRICPVPEQMNTRSYSYDIQPIDRAASYFTLSYSPHPRLLNLVSRSSLSIFDLRCARFTVRCNDIASLCNTTISKSTAATQQQQHGHLHGYGQYIGAFTNVEYHAMITTSNAFVYFDLRAPKHALLKLPFALPNPVSRIASARLVHPKHGFISDVVACAAPNHSYLSVAQALHLPSHSMTSMSLTANPLSHLSSASPASSTFFPVPSSSQLSVLSPPASSLSASMKGTTAAAFAGAFGGVAVPRIVWADEPVHIGNMLPDLNFHGQRHGNSSVPSWHGDGNQMMLTGLALAPHADNSIIDVVQWSQRSGLSAVSLRVHDDEDAEAAANAVADGNLQMLYQTTRGDGAMSGAADWDWDVSVSVNEFGGDLDIINTHHRPPPEDTTTARDDDDAIGTSTGTRGTGNSSKCRHSHRYRISAFKRLICFGLGSQLLAQTKRIPLESCVQTRRIICSSLADEACYNDDEDEKGKEGEEEEKDDDVTKDTNRMNLNWHDSTRSGGTAVPAATSRSRGSRAFIPRPDIGVDSAALAPHGDNSIVDAIAADDIVNNINTSSAEQPAAVTAMPTTKLEVFPYHIYEDGADDNAGRGLGIGNTRDLIDCLTHRGHLLLHDVARIVRHEYKHGHGDANADTSGRRVSGIDGKTPLADVLIEALQASPLIDTHRVTWHEACARCDRHHNLPGCVSTDVMGSSDGDGDIENTRRGQNSSSSSSSIPGWVETSVYSTRMPDEEKEGDGLEKRVVGEDGNVVVKKLEDETRDVDVDDDDDDNLFVPKDSDIGKLMTRMKALFFANENEKDDVH